MSGWETEAEDALVVLARLASEDIPSSLFWGVVVRLSLADHSPPRPSHC